MTSTAASDQEAQALVSHRNSSFYFDDGMVVFLVDGELFKVHRHFFIQSSKIFQNMFSTANTNQEGLESDERPIVLPNTTRAEFQALLKFFYSLPSRVYTTGPVEIPGVTYLTLKDRISLLSVSCQFLLKDTIQFISQQVQPSPTVTVLKSLRVINRYNLVCCLASQYVTLLDRSPEDLSTEEAEALGFERVAQLYKAKCFMYEERIKQAGEEVQSDQADQVLPFPDPSQVNSSKSLTPTSDVVEKFFES